MCSQFTLFNYLQYIKSNFDSKTHLIVYKRESIFTNVNPTCQVTVVGEDTGHLIVGIQGIQRVIVAQVTRFRTFVVSCQIASAFQSFFITLFHALYFGNLLQRCMACCHTSLLSKRCHTLNSSITQSDGQQYSDCNVSKMFKTECHGIFLVETQLLLFSVRSPTAKMNLWLSIGDFVYLCKHLKLFMYAHVRQYNLMSSV